MAVTAKDGTHHHSASRARLHDEMAASRGKSSGVVQKKDPADSGDKSHMPGPTETPIEEHVVEHGPAHAIHYHHDQDGDGLHHVSSYHGEAPAPPHNGVHGQGGENQDAMGGGEEPGGEKHMSHPGAHHSRHKTHAAAHEHMGKAMGVEHGEEEEESDSHAEPDGDEGGASGIPGLS